MRFYCPNCQKEYEAEPTQTITTQNQRVAYKAACPVCGQDMAEFAPTPASENPDQAGINEAEQPADPVMTDAQQALNAAAQDLSQHPVETAMTKPEAETPQTAGETTDQTAV